jgi:hypothetical protein
MADDTPALTRLERLVSSAASVVAPLTVLTALLFYFGYASSRAQYEYFGIDVDTIGLNTQDYVMRSPQPLLTPLLVLMLLTVAVAMTHELVRGRIGAAVAGSEDSDPDIAAESRHRLMRVRRLVRVMVLAGQVLLVAGVLLLIAYAYLREWTPYPLVTPLLMALGAALVVYGRRIEGLLSPREPSRRAAALSISLVLAISIFWATATLAEWSGRGLARDAALHLDILPNVILDTKERLFLTSPNITETVLPQSPDQTFHYRYRGLRLLIQGPDRLFLVPDSWSASNSTLVVPMNDGSVRLQFQFQNQPP